MIGLIVKIVILEGNSEFVFCHPVLNFGHRFTFKRLFWWILASFKDQLKVSKCLRIVVPNEWHLCYILSLWEALVVLDASSIELCDIVETKKFFKGKLIKLDNFVNILNKEDLSLPDFIRYNIQSFKSYTFYLKEIIYILKDDPSEQIHVNIILLKLISI